jgi:hypothetical protein
MRKTFGLLILGWTLSALPASAVLCTIDDVPAATLLLPYFEVDLTDPNGLTTLFSINNSAPTAVLAHVVVWSDLSVPVIDFNVYLTGYDVQTINLRDILTSGQIPATASAGQDPTGMISPQGCCGQDINIASCNGQLPPPPLPFFLIDSLRRSLTGVSAPHLMNRCAGLNYGDNHARGYVTVDTVNSCAFLFPGDPGYFIAGGVGVATTQNVLLGDYFYVDSQQNFAASETLVHIEAEIPPTPPIPPILQSGDYTFYGRYVGWTAADHREPLATNFFARYADGGLFTDGTDLLVWRDSKMVQNAFNCNLSPSWFPLQQDDILVFDEQEQCDRPGTLPFPAETQRVHVNGPDLPTPFSFGWMFLDLNQSLGASPNPPADPLAAQAWVTTLLTASGRFTTGHDAFQFDSACQAVHATVCP